MSENQKRPPWWRIRARAQYDADRRNFNEIMARVLPKEEAESWDVELPPSWTSQPSKWLLSKFGKKGLPKGSGFGLVQSPATSFQTMIYGVSPIADLKKYRTMYRNHPDIQQAIEMQVNMALGRGFTIKHKNEEVVKYLEKVCNDINLLLHMLVMGTDCLTYGNSYTEIQWDETLKKKEQLYNYKGEIYTKKELSKVEASQQYITPATMEINGQIKNVVAQRYGKSKKASRILGLKDLDPLYMRVRRDSFGNVFGYLQNMTYPPILIDNERLIHVKYRPKSWGYESAYGVSVLLGLIKNTELLNQFENDAAIWIHSRAVPPFIIKGGTPEKPYTTPQMTELMSLLSTRTAASMIFAKSDVTFEEMKTIASDMNINWWIDYLLLKRFQALGVPPVLLGMREIGGRATAEVLLHQFVTQLQILQEFIADPIEEYIFRPLIDAEFGEDVENAEIIWKPVVEEDRNMRSQRLIQLLQAGGISVNEIRSEMGFARLEGKKYDEVTAKPTGTLPGGFPPKQPPATQKIPEVTPEERMKVTPKKEEIKVKKFQLMQIEEAFREKMVDNVRKAKFELNEGSKLVKTVRDESKNEARELIDKYVVASYLIGRVKANRALGKEDDLSLQKEDLAPLSEMKAKLLSDFDNIIEEMIENKMK